MKICIVWFSSHDIRWSFKILQQWHLSPLLNKMLTIFKTKLYNISMTKIKIILVACEFRNIRHFPGFLKIICSASGDYTALLRLRTSIIITVKKIFSNLKV